MKNSLHGIDLEHKLFKKSFKYLLGIRITISKITLNTLVTTFYPTHLLQRNVSIVKYQDTD